MQKITALLLLSLSYIYVNAQTGSISGTIYELENLPALYANVILQSPTDSSMIKGGIADENGIFSLQSIPYGQYQIMVSYIGFENYYSPVFELNTKNYELPQIALKEMSNELATLTVTAQRPILEMKPDKMVFNVEGPINNSGSNGLELLRKSPGVMVDNNNNVNLLGKSGVKIFIDGKESPLSGDDLAAFLQTLQSDQINAIEIITNPSAKYDAEGNAGIINIKLKKNKNLGANANLSLSYAKGIAANVYSSINGNYRSEKVNVFGNYGYNWENGINYLHMYQEQAGQYFDAHSDMSDKSDNHSYKFGADYFISDKSTIGFLTNGYSSDWIFNSTSRTPISKIGNSSIERILIANSEGLGTRKNNNYNVNYRFDNGKERTLNIDLDYGSFKNDNEQSQPNFYYDGTETNILTERTYFTNSPTDINIYTAKLDYEQPALKGKLGMGVKSAFVTTDNTFDFYNVLENIKELDEGLSSKFVYKENVNAAYVNYSTKIKKLGINSGLRAEQTMWTGDLTTYMADNDSINTASYIDFFPSIAFSYQLNEKNGFNLSYSRRINRPSYQDLNPFQDKLDERTSEKGNPFLSPEYTNNFQLQHSFSYQLTTTLNYSRTNNVITRLVDIDSNNPEGNFITWENLASQDHYSISLASPITITKWWSSYTNLNLYHMHNKADYGNGKTIDLKATTFNMYTQHTFQLPYDASLEVSSWYVSPSIWGGNFEMDSMFDISMGIQKKILQDKGKIKFSVSDIFKTNDWSGTSQLGELYTDASGGWDSRKVNLTFSYMFGNNNVKSRNRSTGLESENSRIKKD